MNNTGKNINCISNSEARLKLVGSGNIKANKNLTLEIPEEVYVNERNCYKMVDNKKLKALLSDENDLDVRFEIEKKIFSEILKSFFKEKFHYIKIQEGRLRGLFMIINKNRLF